MKAHSWEYVIVSDLLKKFANCVCVCVCAVAVGCFK